MKHPYLYLWAVSIACLILLFFNSYPDSTFDINVHDTYYIVPHQYAYILPAILYFIIGLPYLLPVILKKKLLVWPTHLHVWGSILFFLYVVSLIYTMAFSSLPQLYYTNSAFDSVSDGLLLISFLIIFVLIQLLALINCIVALIKKS